MGWEFAHTYEVVKDEAYDGEENGASNGNDSRKFVVSLFFFRNLLRKLFKKWVILWKLITGSIIFLLY